MTPVEAQSRQQARLWSAACGISAFLNLAAVIVVLAWMSFSEVISLAFQSLFSSLGISFPPPVFEPPPRPPAIEESVATIIPEVAPVSETKTEEGREQQFARTSPDQESVRPEAAAFIGERNTKATSDAPPVAAADPQMPSQRGEEDEDNHPETTESNYQDGDLGSDAIAPPAMDPFQPSQQLTEAREGAEGAAARGVPDAPGTSVPDGSVNPGSSDTTVPPETAASAAPPLAKDPIAEGPYPVERPRQMTPPEAPKPATPGQEDAPKDATSQSAQAQQESRPAVKTPTPGFNGFQRKTHIQGSITRQGRSALDVEDSLLGRYHASLSRAVEKEWQLNCVRNRDYITPGQIIVRFVLEPSGKVRSLSFVEEFGVGNIQKGFTSESIRTARIPPFPAELKKQLDGEPLEVTYSFTF
ncbi:hypothetical protein OJ996_24255 [Luteolibacter sp. GHJ8]|uniref:TonB family protein n=1 Tax=Luteolibacter rhizosphaerae TaxID=2989719 RepID=A0ABT3GA45_9BACT|nr:hypothetical protein [Luteolibacter rhizosphaerae]MCW1916722.1 hypothetical protein [Luteolibacter rhizosphaerae]